ncbi:nuclease [Niabella ginsenosidivorans]|uniref:Nuclease n=1 Tax=Niabella ginsenosidivorans TaxID=1176587 RepID=A0A1A9I5Y2_9BACT|nr:thermonuclease family protein [Niabella ginsenosidivorans]ANH83107.1 nuclease [Niabella ginsenosidivorans]
MIRWSATILLLLLIACNGLSGKTYNSGLSGAENKKAYKVIGIKDGDTFVLLIGGKQQVVRLAHIDCPEKKQPFGNRAKQFAAGLCFGKEVTLIQQHQYDRNKRLIAEVILEDGRNLNKELVKNGLAWHFKRYSHSREYAALETAARLQKKGLWADEKPVAPWNWRHRKKPFGK